MPNYKKKVTTTKGGSSPLQQIFGSGGLGAAGLLASLFMGNSKPVKKVTKYKR